MHFESPNPTIDFAGSPFVVNDRLSDWPRGRRPAARRRQLVRRRRHQCARGDGRSAAAARLRAGQRPAVAGAVGAHARRAGARGDAAGRSPRSGCRDANLADVAWTLAVGRKAFAHRAGACAPTTSPMPSRSCAVPRPTPRIARSRPARAERRGVPVPGAGRAVRRHGPRAVRGRTGLPRGIRCLRRCLARRTRLRPARRGVRRRCRGAAADRGDAAGDLRDRIFAGAAVDEPRRACRRR